MNQLTKKCEKCGEEFSPKFMAQKICGPCYYESKDEATTAIAATSNTGVSATILVNAAENQATSPNNAAPQPEQIKVGWVNSFKDRHILRQVLLKIASEQRPGSAPEQLVAYAQQLEKAWQNW